MFRINISAELTFSQNHRFEEEAHTECIFIGHSDVNERVYPYVHDRNARFSRIAFKMIPFKKAVTEVLFKITFCVCLLPMNTVQSVPPKSNRWKRPASCDLPSYQRTHLWWIKQNSTSPRGPAVLWLRACLRLDWTRSADAAVVPRWPRRDAATKRGASLRMTLIRMTLLYPTLGSDIDTLWVIAHTAVVDGTRMLLSYQRGTFSRASGGRVRNEGALSGMRFVSWGARSRVI